MIKLELSPRPKQLTDELVKEKTLEYKNDNNKKVWNISWLRNAVLELAYGKCCYSEILLEVESNYMEIDHFFPKHLYPEDVMAWGNLFPSGKTCNTTKGQHDTKLQPIINPFKENPKDYLYMEDGIYHERDDSDKGKRTWQKLGLNKPNLFKGRDEITKCCQKELEYLRGNIEQSDDLGKHIERLKQYMDDGNRKKRYAAWTSTTILTDKNYQYIEQSLKEKHLWDAELQALKAELEFCALIK